MSWTFVLSNNESKQHILSIMHVDTMKNLAYIIDEDCARCSNRFHNLIRPSGIFKKISI